MAHTGNESLRLKMVGMSAASMLAEDRRRGGVKGGGRTLAFEVPASSSPLLGIFKGGVLVSELLGDSVIIRSLSLSDSSAMKALWLRRLAWRVKEEASGLCNRDSER